MDGRRGSGLWVNGIAPREELRQQTPPITPTAPPGPFQYYQPPTARNGDGVKRSYSQRAASGAESGSSSRLNGVDRSDSKKNPKTLVATAKALTGDILHAEGNPLQQRPNTTSDELAQIKHIQHDGQSPLQVDPEYVPDNLRATAWSPEPTAPHAEPPSQGTRRPTNAPNTSESLRRSSIPDRSPLQHLESWSKEEKRARLEEAEKRVKQKDRANDEQTSLSRRSTVRETQNRAVSDGPLRDHRRSRVEDPRFRQTSEGIQAPRWEDSDQVRTVESVTRTAMNPSLEISSPKQRRSVPVANESRPAQPPTEIPKDSGELNRSASKHARRGSREYEAAVERGKAAYERRKSMMQQEVQQPLPSPTSPVSPITPERDPASQFVGNRGSMATQGQSVDDRRPTAASARAIPAIQGQHHVDDPVTYATPPQTDAGQAARQQVGFNVPQSQEGSTKDKRHRFGDFLHHTRERRSYLDSSQPLEDWRRADIARLTAEDVEFERTTAAAAAAAAKESDATWWEKDRRASASTPRSQVPNLAQYDGPYEERANGFHPRLFLKCGPLLRYTGIKTETSASFQPGESSSSVDKEIWRGTVLIVTRDDQSDLSRTPSLRLFAQPMTLYEPQPRQPGQSAHDNSAIPEDPLAGQVKLSRTGRAIYVRPVNEIRSGVDLSREESNNGLYSATRSRVVGPEAYTNMDGKQGHRMAFLDKSRVNGRDGEKARRYREVKAIKLHAERGYTFWRFNIEVELGSQQHRIAYRINKGPAMAFWVPARGETMNMMFHSCNGFSLSVNSAEFCGPDPLWRDVLNRHQSRPFHVMIGGGDQIYNDAAIRDTTLFRQWLNIKNPEHKYHADFTEEMQNELETFYLERYCMWFSQGLFGMANSQIPMINIWDDHDIIDGYGSYPKRFMSTSVFTGLGAIAFKYYMLFQHQSLAAETEKEEPSWLLGGHPGPYINQLSRSVYMSLGKKVAFLGLDCRTERMRDEILSQETYDLIFDRCRTEIVKGQTRHLIVLLGVPIAYPRLNFLENILTSRVMDPIKAMGRAGMLGGFVNKFDGGVEILDDLDDHWTAKHHKAERNWFIQELQELASEKSVRITILGGDVHLGAVGQFYTAKKLGVPKDKDHRYMPNVISSAIVNTPPPTVMADVLNKRNKIHHLDDATDEDMIPMFDHDVDGSRRNNRHLLPRRNFCIIREWVPGSTPPASPRLEPTTSASAAVGGDGADEKGMADRRFPPGSMKRTLSLGRGMPNLVRRLSGSKRQRPPVSLEQQRATPSTGRAPYSQQSLQRANSLGGYHRSDSFDPGDDARPSFRRRPTNLSEKEIRNGGLDGTSDGHIDLQEGLDVSLCMEVDQHDPLGATIPYRLLVPALWYEGHGDLNTAKFQSHRRSLMDRLRGFRSRETPMDGANEAGSYNDSYSIHSRGVETRTPSPVPHSGAGLSLTNSGQSEGYEGHPGAVDDGYGHDDRQRQNRQQTYPYASRLAPAPTGNFGSTSTASASNTQSPSGYRRASTSNSRPHAPRQESIDAHTARNTAANRSANPDYLDGHSDNGTFSTETYDDAGYTPQHEAPNPYATKGARAERFFGTNEPVPTSTNPATNGGGFLRKLSLQHDRKSSDATRPGADTDATLSRSASARKPAWKIWK